MNHIHDDDDNNNYKNNKNFANAHDVISLKWK